MAYDLRVEKKSNYLHMTVTGDNCVESVMSYLIDAHAACMRYNCPYVLLVENLRGPPLTIEQIYRIASIGSTSAFPTVRIVSCVDLNPEHIPLRMQIAESVVNQAGLRIHWLPTVDAAEKWLHEAIHSESTAAPISVSAQPPMQCENRA